MDRIRYWMLITGIVIVLTGLAWVAHGTELIRLPATGFMREHGVWTVNGALVIVFGLIVLLGSWRLLRDIPPAIPEDDDTARRR